MEYLIDLKFEDLGYNALIHFVTTLKVNKESEAIVFFDELVSGFTRKGVIIFTHSYKRIDLDPEIRERSYAYCNFCEKQATASIKIEQFFLDEPDQTKSLTDNLIEKILNGQNSTARIGKKYEIPVKASNKKTGNPITGEIYYFSIEHLIPRQN